VEGQLLGVRDVADQLGLHRGTIYRLARESRIPCVLIGNRKRFRQTDIDRFIQERSISAIEPSGCLGQIFLDNSLDGFDKRFLEGGISGMSNQTRWRYAHLGTVYFRKNPGGTKSWGIDYRDENGMRRQEIIKGAQSRGQAAQVLIQRAKRVFNLQHGIPEQKKISFSDFAAIYIQTHGRMKASGQTDEYRLRRLKVHFKNLDIAGITPMMVKGYVAARLRENKSKLTINRELALLKTMFTLAMEEGYVTENPVKKVKMFSERDTVRDRVLSEDEEARLLGTAPARLRPVILVALNAGLRRGEILNLQWKNVDMEKRVLKIEKTKSKKMRYIPVNSVLLNVLNAQKAERRGGERLFPFKVRPAFEKACKDAGIECLTFHDLRRTFGTRLLERGVDIVTISKLYGHSSLLVTQRYLHPKDSTAVGAVEMLAEKNGKRKERESLYLLHSCDMRNLGLQANRLFSVN
jgi:excisionase family DNA binding protein